MWSSSCAPEQDREYVPYITKAVNLVLVLVHFLVVLFSLRHVCRRVCMLYIKRLPGGNSGVQWLLALIPSPRPSVCPSLSALEKTAGAHCTATTLLPFLTSHTKVYMATNVTKRLICAVCWHLVRLDDINGIPCNSHFW